MNQERVIAASSSSAQGSADGAPIEQAADAPSPGGLGVEAAANRVGTVRLGAAQRPGNAEADVEQTMQVGTAEALATGALNITDNGIESSSLPFLEDGAGRRFVLRPGVNTIGRDHTDIMIADRSVSRYHGMIVFDEERDLYSVEDSGSMNGSRVNGERLLSHRPRAIHPGDQITFGDIILRFVDAAHAGVAPKQPDHIATPEELAEVAHEIEAAPTPLLEEFLWLKLLRGDAPEEILVGQGVTTFGRLADNMVCLSDDRYVSGHHAKIEANGQVFLLLDVGSTNGTYLNGLRLTTNTAVAMSDGDEVLLGGLLFQVYKPTLDAAFDVSANDAFADYQAEETVAANGIADQYQPG